MDLLAAINPLRTRSGVKARIARPDAEPVSGNTEPTASVVKNGTGCWSG